MRGVRGYLLRLAIVAGLAALMVVIGGQRFAFYLSDRRLRALMGEENWTLFNNGGYSAEIEAVLRDSMTWIDSAWIWIAIMAMGLLAAMVTGWIGARPVLTQLETLRQVARQVGSGDLSARVPVTRPHNEIDIFARDFNTLVARVERAEREMRGSAASIAHELRTPLTVIQGRLTGMIDGVFPADPPGLALLQRQVGLLTRLVEDLRFLTLFDAGRMRFVTGPVDLAQIVRETVATENGSAAPELELDEITVQADAGRIMQALRALIANAACHAGGADRVTLSREAGAAVLRVMDRGAGLAPDMAERVFDRFWQQKQGGGGSGLGLSVVSAIARGHGGQVRALPREGGGTVFELRIPLVSTKP